MTPKRKRPLKPPGSFWLAEYAMIGVTKARPVRIAAGIARIASGPPPAPKAVITPKNTPVASVRRREM